MTIATAVVASLVLGACSGSRGGPRVQLSPGTRLIASLQPFDACGDMLDYLHREGAKRVGPYGLPSLGGYGGVMPMGQVSRDISGRESSPMGPVANAGSSVTSEKGGPVSADALQAGTDYSGTNVQEGGVDEADFAKTDGNRLVVITQGRLQVLDTSETRPSLSGTVALPGDEWDHQLLLEGDRALVLSNGMRAASKTGKSNPDSREMPYSYPYQAPTAVLTEIDLSDPTKPQIVATLTIDGTQVSARSIGRTARIVMQSDPSSMGFVSPQGPEGDDVATETNRSIIDKSTIDDWLPSYTLDDKRPSGSATSKGRLVPCDQVSRPPEFSGFGALSVLTVDLSKPLGLGDAVSVLASGQNVYASSENLYIATTRYTEQLTDSSAPPTPSAPTTEIHAFEITGTGPARYLASGQVKGTLLNQFSMSEHKGHLRVATTIESVFWATPMPEPIGPDDAVQSTTDPSTAVSESMVSVLAFDEGRLSQVGQVGGLGRNERIYAVRFIGNRGYVVTFRQTDPLYVVDLSDPTAPAVRGELKVAGYSSYLHPVGENLLLGLGQDATEEGRIQGTQLSLFDVSDPTVPKRLQNYTMPQSSSEAEYDHLAFLYWPKSGLTVIPVQSYATENPFIGALTATVDKTSGITEKGRITQPISDIWAGNIRRSMMIGDLLYTISDIGIQASDPSTLASQSWITFPAQ
ncbi:MAG: beta-propeller domain-containing protein [Acidimicrobiales bacterium]